MSPDEAVDAAAQLLGGWLATMPRDVSTLRKIILGIENIDVVLYPAKLQALIDEAQRDAEVGAMSCALGAEFVNQAESIPKLLREYLAGRLKGIGAGKTKTGKRGKHPYDNLTRDFAIMYVVARLKELGFDATRNKERREGTVSACLVTTKALGKIGLHMSEDAVESIWGDRSRLPENLRQYIDEGNENLPHGLVTVPDRRRTNRLNVSDDIRPSFL